MNRPLLGVSVVAWLGLWAYEALGEPAPNTEAWLWMGLWFATFAVSVSNLADSIKILRADGFDSDHLIIIRGHVRRELFRCLASLAMVLVGVGAISGWNQLTVPLLFFGAIALLDNSLLDRIDRRRLLR